MARQPRVHFPGAIYHVIVRGNGGQTLFHSDTAYQRFLWLLSACSKRFSALIHSYGLMPNHAHALIEVTNQPLSGMMQALESRFAQYFHWKRQTNGHLFQGRYAAILCQRDAQLLAVARYIDRNPVPSLVAKPEDWRWSSHRAYLGAENPIVHTDLIRSLLDDGKDPAIAYARFISGGDQAPWPHNTTRAWSEPPPPCDILGPKPEKKTPGAASALLEAAERFALERNLSTDSLRADIRTGPIAAAKREFARVAREKGHTYSDIALMMRISKSVAWKWVVQEEENEGSDPSVL